MHETVLDTGWEHFKGTLGGLSEVWGEGLPWKAIRLPHCYNAYDAVDPDRRYYQGEAWYRARIGPGSSTAGNERILLLFRGGGPEIEVYVGSERAGSCYSCGEESFVDITDACKHYAEGGVDLQGIPLALRCDNRRDCAALPADDFGIVRYGGLFRQVSLVRVPDVSVRNLCIRYERCEGAAVTVSVDARLYNPDNRAVPLTFELNVTGPDGSVCETARFKKDSWAGTEALHSFTLNPPVYWSPSSPSLYECTLVMAGPGGKTEYTDRFGVRFAEFVPHGPFLLNGERFLLHGLHRYGDTAGRGAALTGNDIDRQLQLAKEAGANLIRTVGGPPSRYFADRCDELGLFLWAELPWNGTGAADAVVQERGRTALTAMMEQHRNRPSVVVWGLCAGEAGIAANADKTYLQELQTLATALDPGRLTGSIHAPGAAGITGLHIPRLLGPDDDPHGFKTRVQDAIQSSGRLMIAELHAEHLAGFHEDIGADGKCHDTPQRATETAFCHQLEHQLNILEHLPSLAGYFGADLNDHAAPLRPDAPIPNVCATGIVTRDLEPKAGFYTLRSVWCKRPFVHVYGHGLEVRAGKPADRRELRVYSNCPSVESFLNGVSLGVKERNPGDFPAAGLRWALSFKKGKNLLKAVGMAGKETVTDSLELEYLTERWNKPRKFRMKVKRFRHGRRRIIAKALDQRGNFCPDAELTVRFTIAGTGSLLDNRGTVEGSKVVKMTNGIAAVWAVGNHGFSTVAVTGEGMRGVFKRMR